MPYGYQPTPEEKMRLLQAQWEAARNVTGNALGFASDVANAPGSFARSEIMNRNRFNNTAPDNHTQSFSEQLAAMSPQERQAYFRTHGNVVPPEDMASTQTTQPQEPSFLQLAATKGLRGANEETDKKWKDFVDPSGNAPLLSIAANYASDPLSYALPASKAALAAGAAGMGIAGTYGALTGQDPWALAQSGFNLGVGGVGALHGGMELAGRGGRALKGFLSPTEAEASSIKPPSGLAPGDYDSDIPARKGFDPADVLDTHLNMLQATSGIADPTSYTAPDTGASPGNDAWYTHLALGGPQPT